MHEIDPVKILIDDMKYLRQTLDDMRAPISQIPDIKTDMRDVKNRVGALENANLFAKGYQTGGLWVFGIVCGGVGAAFKMLFAWWPHRGS